jgi:hypothetical protein
MSKPELIKDVSLRIKNGEELVLDALRNDLKRLQARADRAKAASDEYTNATDEIIALHHEFVGIIESKVSGQECIDRLASLKKRREKASKVREKDYIKLLDKEHQTAFERDRLQEEIGRMEFRISLRKNHG